MRRRQPERDVDTCVLVSLFHGDSGFGAAEAWLISAADPILWISHWVLLEPGGEDFLVARQWIESGGAAGLRAADGLHLALAHRQGLRLVSADQLLVSAAHGLGIEAELVA